MALIGGQIARQIKPGLLGQRGGKAQHPVKRGHHGHEAFDLRPLGAGDMFEQRGQRFFLAQMHALFDRFQHDARALVIAQIGADLVFLDHREIGVGGGFRAADHGQNGGVLRRFACLARQLQQRGHAPPARDQTIAGAGAFAAIHHLDRGLLAPVAQTVGERLQFLRIGGEPVADQMRGIDLQQRQTFDHPAFGAALRDLLRQFRQRRTGRGFPGHIGNRRAAARGRVRHRVRGRHRVRIEPKHGFRLERAGGLRRGTGGRLGRRGQEIGTGRGQAAALGHVRLLSHERGAAGWRQQG